MPSWILLALAFVTLLLAMVAPFYPRFSSLGGRIPLGRWALFGVWTLALAFFAVLFSQGDPRVMSAEGVSQADSVRTAREAARAVEEAQRAAADSAAVQDDRLIAYLVAEGAVRLDPRAPADVRFPGAEEGRVGHVTRLGDRRYEIRSYLDGTDPTGVPSRSRWTARVERGEGEAWEVRDLIIEDAAIELAPATP